MAVREYAPIANGGSGGVCGDGAAIDVKVRRRLLPVLFAAALLCYLDRTNLSFAALQMNSDLGFGERVYGIGAGVFFATYAGFGVPASVACKKVGARVGLPAILVAWGVASGSMAFIQGVRSFYALRLIVGATEAGFFPGVIYYLTLFVAEEDMGLSYTIVMTATALSGIVGGPLAGLVMTYAGGAGGLEGWRWLFIVEAAPTVALGIFMLFYLDADPAHARFLDHAEREWLVARQRRQHDARDSDGGDVAASAGLAAGLGVALRMRWLWIMVSVWLLYSCGYYGVIFWMPLLLKSLGSSSDVMVGFLSAIPYACAAVAMIAVARSSDASRERRVHLAAGAIVAAAGFFAAASAGAFFSAALPPLLLCLCVSTAGVYSMFGPYWGIPTALLSGETAAAGFALINSVGVVGGFVGPWLVGHLTEETGNYDAALAVFGGMMLASGALALCLDRDIARRDPVAAVTETAPIVPEVVPIDPEAVPVRLANGCRVVPSPGSSNGFA